MRKQSGRSVFISDDEEDENPLPSKASVNPSSAKRKSDFSDNAEVPAKQSKTEKSPSGKGKPGNQAGSSSKSPKEKFQATQLYRSFLNREPPRCLGSKEIPQGQDNCMEGMTFVITGVFESIDRDETKNLIQRYGGRVVTNVCKSTTYLVAGRDCGDNKLRKAEEFNTKMLDEDALFDLVRRLPAKKSKYEIAAENEALKKGKGSSKKGAQWSQSTQSKSGSQLSSFSSPQSQKSLFSASQSQKSMFSANSQSQQSMFSASQSSGNSQSMENSVEMGSSSAAGSSESQLWVDKYKPVELRQVIGQQGDKSNAKKLLTWLKNWRENYSKKPAWGPRANDSGVGNKAALLSGPPGVGKTTTAQLVCKELGFSYVELNASDTRSKRSLQDEIAVALGSRTLVDFFGKDQGLTQTKDSWKHCLIMDEVDGMAGNEDRGGMQELIQLIKKTKVPVICICNDRSHPKIRSLSNYCFDLRFQRPRVEQIKGAIMTMTFKEGLKIPPAALNDIIVAANQDIRQVIHNLSMWTIKDKSLTFDQLKTEADKSKKDMKLGVFDVCRKVFVGGDETANMTLTDKIDLFFNDYSIVPLFVQENYISVMPYSSRGSMQNCLNCLSKASDSIAYGDIVDGLIRRGQNWNLLPVQSVFSSVIPGDTMRGSIGQMINFPSWLGKNSTQSKNSRIIQELMCHMGLNVSANKRSLSMEYLPYMRSMLSTPLANEGTAGVESVIALLDAYDLMREDFDSIMDLTSWSSSANAMEKIESKVKAAFTRSYNKTVRLKPYATGVMSKKGRKKPAGDDVDMEGLEEGLGVDDEAGNESEGSDKEDIVHDSMIKQKKNAKAMAKIKQLNDIEEGNYVPESSKKSHSPKKSSPKKTPTVKQSQTPKASQPSKCAASPKKRNVASKVPDNSSVPVKTTSQSPVPDSVTRPNTNGDKELSEKKLNKDTLDKVAKVPASSPLTESEPVAKKMKTKSKAKDSEDVEDFEVSKGKSKSKGSDVTEDLKKSKEKTADKVKVESKPSDAKTKSIASYFKSKPKT